MLPQHETPIGNVRCLNIVIKMNQLSHDHQDISVLERTTDRL